MNILKKFANRPDCHGKQYPKDGKKANTTVKTGITDDVVKAHMKGDYCIGCHTTNPDSNLCKWGCNDIDSEKTDEKTQKENLEAAQMILNIMKEKNVTGWINKSGGIGRYHVWNFCKPTDAMYVYNFLQEVRKEAGRRLNREIPGETYPKQPYISPGSYGNWVKLPLGVHPTTQARCLLVDSEGKDHTLEESIKILEGMPDNDIPHIGTPIVASEYESMQIERPKSANDITAPCYKKMLENGATPGKRHYTMMCIVHWNYQNGCSKENTRRDITKFNRNCEEPKQPSEIERELKFQWDRCVRGQCYKIGCKGTGIISQELSNNCPFDNKDKCKWLNIGKQLDDVENDLKEGDEDAPIETHKSCVLDKNNVLYEQVWDGDKSSFVTVDSNGKTTYKDTVINKHGIEILPISDDALTKGVVLLPDKPEKYIDLKELMKLIQNHIHKYLDVEEDMEVFYVFYVLLTWLQDKTNTINYLKMMGDYNTGKSRGLDTVGRICYKPIIINGALTVAPIFRLLNLWEGTLIIDEGDFKQSDEQANIMKILNAGFERSRASVIRCNPLDPSKIEAFSVYGAKIISSRKPWNDNALESRCLTENMSSTTRKDIIPVLGKEYYAAEDMIRRKLLKFRMDYYDKIDYEYKDIGIELDSRLKQSISSFTILFHSIPEALERFKIFIRKYNDRLIEARSDSYEGVIVQALAELIDSGNDKLNSKNIADKILSLFGSEYKPAGIGKLMASFGMRSTSKKVEGVTKRVFKLNNVKLESIFMKYLPLNHPTRTRINSKVTVVTEVTVPIAHKETTVTGDKKEPKEEEKEANKNKVTVPALYPVGNVTTVTTVTLKEDIIKILDKTTPRETMEIINLCVPEPKCNVKKAISMLKEEGRIMETSPNHWIMV